MRTTTPTSNDGDGGQSPVAWSYRRWLDLLSILGEIRVMLCSALSDDSYWLVFVHFFGEQ